MRSTTYNSMTVDVVIEQRGDGLWVEVWNHNFCVMRMEIAHEHDLLNLQDEVSRALAVVKGKQREKELEARQSLPLSQRLRLEAREIEEQIQQLDTTFLERSLRPFDKENAEMFTKIVDACSVWHDMIRRLEAEVGDSGTAFTIRSIKLMINGAKKKAARVVGLAVNK